MAIETVPVVHVENGELVNPDGSVRPEDPVDTVRRLGRDYDHVYVVDLRGLKRNRPDVVTLKEFAKRATLWIDAGARWGTDAMDMLIVGGTRVTMRWQYLRSRESVDEARQVSDRVYLGLEFDEDGLVENPDDRAPLQDILKFAEAHEMGLVVVDHARAGTQQGVRRDPGFQVRHFAGEKWYAGGIAGRRDLEVLDDLGFDGALVSTAILEGRFL